MKRCFIISTLALWLVSVGLWAQNHDLDKYHRSSLYSIMLKHPEKEYCNEIIEAFKAIPIPDKYNNHDLKIKVMPAPVLKAMTKDEIEGGYKDAILSLLNRNKVGGRLVEKWFDRDKATGAFDMDLVAQRGYYDASVIDINLARLSARGKALLEDAGEELLNHTYVLVNDVRYGDKETIKTFVGGGILAANIFSLISGVDISNTAEQIGGLAGDITGFKVIVTSYLFRLDWNDEVANNFYTNLWVDKSAPDLVRQQQWTGALGSFKLKYIGNASVFSGKTALGGVNSERDMFLKVCTRAVDKSIS